MTKLFTLILILLAGLPDLQCHVTTADHEMLVLEGQSVTFPCHYEPQYASYVKYWCQGRMREFCTSLARTGDAGAAQPGEKVSAVDDQVQQVFTVTMNNLTEADSGWYMCGVEIGSGWTADVASFVYIRVIHGLSTVNNQLRGEEGSSVTFECLYSERYRETAKKWCRAGDWSSCVVTGSDGRYEDASVALSDDRIGSVAVTLKKLQTRDTGWYWCSVGEHKLSVHVQATPPTAPVTSLSSAAESLTSTLTPDQAAADPPPGLITGQSGSSHIPETLLVCSSLTFLAITVVLAAKLWKMRNRPYLLVEQEASLREIHVEKSHMPLQMTFTKPYPD
ncbi:polymeric immunoglobulin receptor isoform X1 [Takifugu rubripes]|uniref:polymeric immunoglobulin receptor isoform X1 n=1 Tax=Takifugu rubripes TaxID=31033 RepID=UPI0011454EF7|nr:polymeric immunoglobulin receptor isoform X1 [Takifugu rubripes]